MMFFRDWSEEKREGKWGGCCLERGRIGKMDRKEDLTDIGRREG